MPLQQKIAYLLLDRCHHILTSGLNAYSTYIIIARKKTLCGRKRNKNHIILVPKTGPALGFCHTDYFKVHAVDTDRLSYRVRAFPEKIVSRDRTQYRYFR